MVLKCGESSDCLAPDLEGRDAVGDPLLGLGKDIDDGLAQLGQCCPLRLLQRIEVLVDFLRRHGPIVLIDERHEQGAQARGGSFSADWGRSLRGSW